MFYVDVNRLFLWQFNNAHWMKNNLAVNLAPSEIMTKSCAESFNHALTCVFLTDSKVWQTLNYYSKSTKRNCHERFYSVNRAWLHKCIQNTWLIRNAFTCFKESKLQKQICIKLTFILFEEVLKSTELLLWVRGRSANVWFSPFKHFRCQTITNNLFFLLRSWFLRSSVN